MMTPAEIARFKRNLQRQRAAVAAALPAQLVQGALVLRQVRLARPCCCPCCGAILRRGQVAYRRAGAGARNVYCAQGARGAA